MLYDHDTHQKTDSSSSSQPAQPSRKGSHPAVNPTQQPAWTKAMGANPPLTLQTKLTVNHPGDVYEQEADRVAEQVMRMPFAGTSTAQEDGSLMRKENDGVQATQNVPPVVEQALSSGGQPLDASTRTFMEPRLGHNFSKVRVHTDGQAAESAQLMDARAYTMGNDVVFGAGQYEPGTSEGRRLLTHELTHVVQQAGTTSSVQRLQRALRPEDVSGEMVGRMFTLTEDFSAPFGIIHPGETLVVRTWVNTSPTVTVALPAPHVSASINFSVPKAILTPIQGPIAGIAQYHADLPATQTGVKRGQADIEAWRAKESSYRTPAARSLFTRELARQESLQATREKTLNRRLIQETMFNRFDPLILKWTDFYNEEFKIMGWGKLDPNLVKSMLFKESQLGTSGPFLFPDASTPDPRKKQFNLGSIIDSSASALLLMISEIQPALLATHHLENIRADLSAAQAELRHLRAHSTHLNAVQRARLTELIHLSELGGTWENFLWSYRAPGQTTGLSEAALALFATSSGGRPLGVDYEFWIRTAIRWLFEKRRGVSSWNEAIRAYNGSGAAARHYRDIVVGRAKRAESSGAAGIIPEGI